MIGEFEQPDVALLGMLILQNRGPQLGSVDIKE
jgi:hypothetical protein